MWEGSRSLTDRKGQDPGAGILSPAGKREGLDLVFKRRYLNGQREDALKDKNLDQLPDDRLVGMFLEKKEKRVFEALYERYKNMVWAYVRKTLYALPEDIAGDLMHEIFIKVYLELAGLKDPRAFRTWLFRLARTVCLRHIRSDKPPASSLDDEKSGMAASGLADRRIDLEDDYIRSELREVVFREIDRLPAESRETLLLKIMNRLTHEEIADILKVSVRTVKYRISGAIDRLSGKLIKEGYI